MHNDMDNERDGAQGVTLQQRDRWRARNRGRFVMRDSDVVLVGRWASTRTQRRLACKAGGKA